MEPLRKPSKRYLLTLLVLGAFLISLPLTGTAVITSVVVTATDPGGEIATSDFPFSNGFDTLQVTITPNPSSSPPQIHVQWKVATLPGNADPVANVTPCPGNPSNTCLGDTNPATTLNAGAPPNRPNESGPESYVIQVFQATTPGPGQPLTEKIRVRVSSHIVCGASNTAVEVGGAGVSIFPACISFPAGGPDTFSFLILNPQAAAVPFSFDNEFSIQIAGNSGSESDGPGEDSFQSDIIQGTTTTTTTSTTTTSTTSTTTTSSTTTVPTIPTTGEWGMMIFTAALLGFMAWMIQARRSIR